MNFEILVSLRVFWAKTPIFIAIMVSSWAVHEEIYKFKFYNSLFFWYLLRRKEKLGPYLDWSHNFRSSFQNFRFNLG